MSVDEKIKQISKIKEREQEKCTLLFEDYCQTNIDILSVELVYLLRLLSKNPLFAKSITSQIQLIHQEGIEYLQNIYNSISHTQLPTTVEEQFHYINHIVNMFYKEPERIRNLSIFFLDTGASCEFIYPSSLVEIDKGIQNRQ